MQRDGQDAVESFTSLFIKLDQRYHKAMFKLFLEGAKSFWQSLNVFNKIRIPHTAWISSVLKCF